MACGSDISPLAASLLQLLDIFRQGGARGIAGAQQFLGSFGLQLVSNGAIDFAVDLGKWGCGCEFHDGPFGGHHFSGDLLQRWLPIEFPSHVNNRATQKCLSEPLFPLNQPGKGTNKTYIYIYISKL